MSFMRTKYMRFSLLSLTALCTTIAISACSSETDSTEVNTKSASITQPASESPVASAVPSSGTITGLPIEKSCESILSPETIYKINPNYSFAGEESPPIGPQSEIIAQLKGKTCKYVNTSGGAEILVSIAQVTPGSSEALINKINGLGLSQVDVYGQSSQVHGYFATTDEEGIGMAFENQFLVVASSNLFLQSTDPSAFIMGSLNSMK